MFEQQAKRLGGFLGLAFSCIIVYVILIALLDEANARFGAIALSISIIILSHPLAASIRHERFKWLGWLVDFTLIVLFVIAGWYFFQVKEDLWGGFYMATPENIAAGLGGLFVILEATRRAWGFSLIIMALLFIAFGFAGTSLPGMLQHFGMDTESFMQIAWYSFDGVFGRITGLVADTVLIFLIFGAMLDKTGAGESLIRISTSLTSRIRGGAAHAAIVASAVFGMMSGSVAANIAGTGVFTIPMIKRQGFSPAFAAAVETAASSGGQLTPPIMAAAVFIMADMVGMPYVHIIAAATLPALLKYTSLFAQVYVEASRLDLKPLPAEEIPKLTRTDWINALLVFLPIGALMVAFISGKSPAMSGLVGVTTALIAGLILNPKFRREPMRIVAALSEGGVSAAKIMVSVAVIGIVLSVVNETGIAIRFATSIATLGEDNLLLALILAMSGALVLGMGLPTLPAYLIIAIMIAPAIIKAGVDPLAAHLFVLYFAVYSSLVPPIAYGCYISAPIAGSNPLITSLVALRISVVGLLVPYIFVFSPSILLVVDSFSVMELITTMLRMFLAIWMFASSLGGANTVTNRVGIGERLLRLLTASALMIPWLWVWGPGVVMAGLLIAQEWRARRSLTAATA